MSLARRYRPFELYRLTPGASSVDEPTRERVGTYRGFIQPISGSETTQANALKELRSHRLYTSTQTPVEQGDEIEQDGVTYRAVFTTQVNGISSVQHHKEVDLAYV